MAALRHYYNEMLNIASTRRFWLCILGLIDEQQIWLIRTRMYMEHDDPKILIVAGFHGEEKAGPYGILKWIKDCDPELLSKIDLSFIPIVNPTAFAKGTRKNPYGEKSNCGFCHPESMEKPSREGQILINNIDLLRPLAQDGFLSLHEDLPSKDSDGKDYYVYTFEKSKEPTNFTHEILDVLKQNFPKAKPLDGIRVEIDAQGELAGPRAKHGIVYRHCDGSFEDWMFHLGVPRCCVTENPGIYQLKRRINACHAVIDKFIELSLGG